MWSNRFRFVRITLIYVRVLRCGPLRQNALAMACIAPPFWTLIVIALVGLPLPFLAASIPVAVWQFTRARRMGLELNAGRLTVQRIFRPSVSLPVASVASARFELQPLSLLPCPLTIRTDQGAAIKVRGVSRKARILPTPGDRNDDAERAVDQFFREAGMGSARMV